MKKIVYSLIISFTFILNSYSQFDVQNSQYMLNPTAFNPAAVGESGMIDVVLQHRIQWLGMPNGGRTTNFNINSPLNINKSLHGIGLNFNIDKAGQFTNNDVHLQYAFKKKIGTGLLSIGTDIGFVSIGFNGDSVQTHPITLGEYHELTSDTDIPTSFVSGIGFDMGLGIWYSTKKFYGGISYKHINQTTVDWGDKTGFKYKSSLFITSGTNFKITDTKFIVRPSALVKTNFNSWQIDLSSKVDYNNQFWGGLSYRFQDAVAILAGMNITDGLSIGYSYDLPTSNIIRVSSGSHEIVLIYSFAYVFGKKTTRYKSIRFL